MDHTTKQYLEAAEKEHEEIQQLVDLGILSRELCPELNYWHWAILETDLLPEKFSMFLDVGEVRWPGHSGYY